VIEERERWLKKRDVYRKSVRERDKKRRVVSEPSIEKYMNIVRIE
jgi:hypothetical protein